MGNTVSYILFDLKRVSVIYSKAISMSLKVKVTDTDELTSKKSQTVITNTAETCFPSDSSLALVMAKEEFLSN